MFKIFVILLFVTYLNYLPFFNKKLLKMKESNDFLKSQNKFIKDTKKK